MRTNLKDEINCFIEECSVRKYEFADKQKAKNVIQSYIENKKIKLDEIKKLDFTDGKYQLLVDNYIELALLIDHEQITLTKLFKLDKATLTYYIEKNEEISTFFDSDENLTKDFLTKFWCGKASFLENTKSDEELSNFSYDSLKNKDEKTSSNNFEDRLTEQKLNTFIENTENKSVDINSNYSSMNKITMKLELTNEDNLYDKSYYHASLRLKPASNAQCQKIAEFTYVQPLQSTDLKHADIYRYIYAQKKHSNSQANWLKPTALVAFISISSAIASANIATLLGANASGIFGFAIILCQCLPLCGQIAASAVFGLLALAGICYGLSLLTQSDPEKKLVNTRSRLFEYYITDPALIEKANYTYLNKSK